MTHSRSRGQAQLPSQSQCPLSIRMRLRQFTSPKWTMVWSFLHSGHRTMGHSNLFPHSKPQPPDTSCIATTRPGPPVTLPRGLACMPCSPESCLGFSQEETPPQCPLCSCEPVHHHGSAHRGPQPPGPAQSTSCPPAPVRPGLGQSSMKTGECFSQVAGGGRHWPERAFRGQGGQGPAFRRPQLTPCPPPAVPAQWALLRPRGPRDRPP